jgi:hypothetical protein
LHNYGCPRWLISEIVRQIGNHYNFNKDELAVVDDTCGKDPNSDDVSGYDKLIETLTASYIGPNGRETAAPQTVSKIDSIIYTAADRLGFEWKREHAGFNDDVSTNSDDSHLLTGEIKQDLKDHIYIVTSINPVSLIIANTRDRKVHNAVIKIVKNEDAADGSITISNVLVYRHRVIDAIPDKVIIHENKLDKTAPRTYEITWQTSNYKYLKTGPGAISSIRDELSNRNMVLRKNLADDALSSIIRAFETTLADKPDKFEINDKLLTSGYYHIDGRFEYSDITQRIEQRPPVEQVRECIEVFDKLYKSWHDRRIFPTIIKWAATAPFSYIRKTATTGFDNWQEILHNHTKSGGGKTTAARIALAVWRKHQKKDKAMHEIPFGEVDTPARLGRAVSQTTYPIILDDAGDLTVREKADIVEILKSSAKTDVARGYYLNKTQYVRTLALSSIIVTSNPAAPRIDEYQRASICVNFDENEQHSEG